MFLVYWHGSSHCQKQQANKRRKKWNKKETSWAKEKWNTSRSCFSVLTVVLVKRCARMDDTSFIPGVSRCQRTNHNLILPGVAVPSLGLVFLSELPHNQCSSYLPPHKMALPLHGPRWKWRYSRKVVKNTAGTHSEWSWVRASAWGGGGIDQEGVVISPDAWSITVIFVGKPGIISESEKSFWTLCVHTSCANGSDVDQPLDIGFPHRADNGLDVVLVEGGRLPDVTGAGIHVQAAHDRIVVLEGLR